MRHPKHGWGAVLLAAQLAAAGALVVACAEQPAGVDARFAAPGEVRRDTYPATGPSHFAPLHLSSTRYHVLDTEIGDTALTHAVPSTYGNEIHQFDTQWHNTKTEWWLYKDSTFQGPIRRVPKPVDATATGTTTTAEGAEVASRGADEDEVVIGAGEDAAVTGP